MSRELDKAVKVLKKGDKAQARKMLSAILKKEPQNEMAWLWMSQTMNDPQKKRQCFDKVLAINPENEHAQRAIAKLEGRRPPPKKKVKPKNPYEVNTAETQAKAKIIGKVGFLLSGLFAIGGLIALVIGLFDAREFTLESASAEVISWEVVPTGSRANLNIEYTYEVGGETYERKQRVRAESEEAANELASEFGLSGMLPLPPSVYYEAGMPETAEFQSIPADRYDNLYVGAGLLFLALVCVWTGMALKPKEEAQAKKAPAPKAAAAAS